MLEVDVGWINGNYQRILFHRVRTASADRVRRMAPPRRHLALVCFLHQAWRDTLDQAVDMYGKLLDRNRKLVDDRLDDMLKAQRHAVDRIVQRYRRLGAVLLDPGVGDDELRTRLLSTVPEEQLREDQSGFSNWTRGDRRARFEQTAERHAGLSQFAGPFLSRMKFVDEQGEGTSPTLAALPSYREHRAAGRRGVPPDAPLDFAPPALQPLLRRDGVTDRRRHDVGQRRAALRHDAQCRTMSCSEPTARVSTTSPSSPTPSSPTTTPRSTAARSSAPTATRPSCSTACSTTRATSTSKSTTPTPTVTPRSTSPPSGWSACGFAPASAACTASNRQRIYCADPDRDHGVLDPALQRGRRAVNFRLIADQWDRIGQFYAAFPAGHATASAALQGLNRFQASNRFYAANRELGRALKTALVRQYMSEPKLRAKVRWRLLKVEQLHALERAVYYGQPGRISAREVYDQMNACSCLTLILACIVYWQAQEISRLAAAPDLPFDPDLLRHVSPIEWKNVVLYGDDQARQQRRGLVVPAYNPPGAAPPTRAYAARFPVTASRSPSSSPSSFAIRSRNCPICSAVSFPWASIRSRRAPACSLVSFRWTSNRLFVSLRCASMWSRIRLSYRATIPHTPSSTAATMPIAVGTVGTIAALSMCPSPYASFRGSPVNTWRGLFRWPQRAKSRHFRSPRWRLVSSSAGESRL